MEEIFLDDDIDNNNNNNSETVYHRIIRDSFAQVTRLNKHQTDWNLVLDDNHVKVFKHHKENFFKGEMISTAHMHHLTRLFSDVHMVTRRQWDKDTLKDLVLHESYPTEKDNELMHYIEYCIDNRDFMGIQWVRDTAESSFIIFKTCSHPLFKCPKGRTATEFLLTAVWIKKIRQTQKTLVTLMVSMIPASHIKPEWISARMRHIDALAKDAPRFLLIYNPWKCIICNHMIAPHELECRTCKKERYKRCENKQCYRALEKHMDKCPYC